jgi:hypothetical protein
MVSPYFIRGKGNSRVNSKKNHVTIYPHRYMRGRCPQRNTSSLKRGILVLSKEEYWFERNTGFLSERCNNTNVVTHAHTHTHTRTGGTKRGRTDPSLVLFYDGARTFSPMKT